MSAYHQLRNLPFSWLNICSSIRRGGDARGVVLSNSRSRAVMEVLLDELAKCVEEHNCLIERTYRREQDAAVNRPT